MTKPRYFTVLVLLMTWSLHQTMNNLRFDPKRIYLVLHKCNDNLLSANHLEHSSETLPRLTGIYSGFL